MKPSSEKCLDIAISMSHKKPTAGWWTARCSNSYQCSLERPKQLEGLAVSGGLFVCVQNTRRTLGMTSSFQTIPSSGSVWPPTRIFSSASERLAAWAASGDGYKAFGSWPVEKAREAMNGSMGTTRHRAVSICEGNRTTACPDAAPLQVKEVSPNCNPDGYGCA